MRPASLMVRAWVRLYTLGLPADVRDRRREEVASDLWEQQHEAGAGSVWLRVAGGMPADVTWRLGHLFDGGALNVFLGAIMALATAIGLLAAVAITAYGVREGEAAPMAAGPVLLLTTFAAVAGFRMAPRSPKRGAGLMVGAALPMAVIMPWVPLPALAVAGIGILRGYRFSKARSTG